VHQAKNPVPRSRDRAESGLALLTSIMILILVTSVAIAAIGSSEEELRAGGRSRSSANSLNAAEAGIHFARNRLQVPSDITAFSFTLDNGTVVRTGTRTDTVAQDMIDDGLGSPPSGYSINIGQGFVNEIYKVNVTASRLGSPTTELEARMNVLTANAGAY
jgi:Tfp pilus assembly protein PilX